MNILVIGNCGVGKTYLMQKIKETFLCNQSKNVDQLHYVTNESQAIHNQINDLGFLNTINIAGKYDGSTFQGSDRLSMSVMKSVPEYLNTIKGVNIFEGDRFTNGKFIAKSKPFVIKIKGNGKEGRLIRQSNQTERQIKSISTRVGNINADVELDNSTIAEMLLINVLSKVDIEKELKELKSVYKPSQINLF